MDRVRRELVVAVTLLCASCTAPQPPPSAPAAASASAPAAPLTAVPFHAVVPSWVAAKDAGETAVVASDGGAAPKSPPEEPQEPQGSALTNAVTTSSSTVADADRGVLAVRPKLRACYEAARGKGPEIVGMVTCGVRITKAGKVGAVGVTRRNSLPNPLVDCIIRVLGTAVFAPRAEEAVIMVPVRFGTLGEDG